MGAPEGNLLVYDEKVDIFAFGALLYFLIFERLAFGCKYFLSHFMYFALFSHYSPCPLLVSLLVDDPEERDPEYRPALDDSGRCPLLLQALITACWSHRPEERPTIDEALNFLEMAAG